MNINYRTDHGILTVEPTGELREQDFDDLRRELASIRDEKRKFNGVLIETRDFPGYESFSDMFAHGEFVKEHADAIPKVAICTDSNVGGLLSRLGDNLGDTPVKNFGHDERDEAEKWLLS